MGIKTEIIGKFSIFVPDNNGRIYPKEVMEKAIKEYEERIKETKEYKIKLRTNKLKRIIYGS